MELSTLLERQLQKFEMSTIILLCTNNSNNQTSNNIVDRLFKGLVEFIEQIVLQLQFEVKTNTFYRFMFYIKGADYAYQDGCCHAHSNLDLLPGREHEVVHSIIVLHLYRDTTVRT